MEENRGKIWVKDFHFVAGPVTLVATEWEGRANFAPHGQYGTITADPPLIYISVIKEHQTARNIRATGLFSVSIPSRSQLKAVLECGASSGTERDKSRIFSIYPGKSGAPLVRECPVSFGCRVTQSLDFKDCTMFIAQVMETAVDESCLREGKPDVEMVDPFFCSLDGKFWALGEEIKL